MEERQHQPSFAGRLRLADFRYECAGPEQPARPRRNPRRAAAAPARPCPVPARGDEGEHQPGGDDEHQRPRDGGDGEHQPDGHGEHQRPRDGDAERQPDGGGEHQSPRDGQASPAPKRRRRAAAYAPPSTYAHLPLLPDALAPGLLVLFVGLNPGIQTARTGHAYAHPSNLFWKLLFSSGITPRPCRPDEDRHMPALYALGFTNIVARPSRSGAELSRREMDAGVAALELKARTWRPEVVCLVGKGIWESVWRVRHHGSPVARHFSYGWQNPRHNMGVVDGQCDGARVFVASSTSGLAASLSPAEKQRIWNELGAWVKRRRSERQHAAAPERQHAAAPEPHPS